MCNVILATPQGRGKNELITILGTAKLGKCCLPHGSGLLGMTIDFQYSVSVRSLCTVLMPVKGSIPSSGQ
jgi:hypothetical protein